MYKIINDENIFFEEDKKIFEETYRRMQNGTEEIFIEVEANKRTEFFLEFLCKTDT